MSINKNIKQIYFEKKNSKGYLCDFVEGLKPATLPIYVRASTSVREETVHIKNNSQMYLNLGQVPLRMSTANHTGVRLVSCAEKTNRQVLDQRKSHSWFQCFYFLSLDLLKLSL